MIRHVLITFKLLFKSEIALETNAVKRRNTQSIVESIIFKVDLMDGFNSERNSTKLLKIRDET